MVGDAAGTAGVARVLFVTYGGGHVEMCLPVARALRALHCHIDFMALTTAYGVAVNAGLDPLGYRDFTGAPGAQEALRYGEQLLPAGGSTAVAREESLAYLGFNFLEWVRQEGEAAAWQRWRAVGRQGFLPVGFFRHVLARLRPDVVVTTNSPRSEEAALAAAAEAGIPGVAMVDLFALSGDPFIRRRQYADRIAVLCEATRANLLAAGVPDERIVVTGNPAFDELSGRPAVEAGLAWRRQKNWDGLRVVMWAGHREPDDAEPLWAGTALGTAVQDALVRWVDARPGTALIVRYHPNEWEGFTPPAPHPRIHWSMPDREALLPVLSAADDVVVQITTVGVQAAMAGKRVICLRFSPFVRSSGMDYAALGLAVSVDTVEDLLRVLDAKTDAETPGAGGNAQLGLGQPGAAADAVANVIYGLVARGNFIEGQEA